MESLYFLIPIAIIFVTIAIKVFFWAVNNGQYDDLETEGRRILFDDDAPSAVAAEQKHSANRQEPSSTAHGAPAGARQEQGENLNHNNGG
ncbi:hypothetical protein Maes01_02746 [Microbulbifer aestuariivivens]|uniref:Cbb3-type cytochrome oxidase assembly protein CcoS n=1 Tax=Microbulbifer aestuariivivens TaxID=1908308 RepID=A0ABP9WVV0_9GAMM